MTDAILKLKPNYVYLPSISEMRETSNIIEQRFKLRNVALGVDGIHCQFATVSRLLSSLVNTYSTLQAPRGIPDEQEQQFYWCRKQFYSLNCMVIISLSKYKYWLVCYLKMKCCVLKYAIF